MASFRCGSYFLAGIASLFAACAPPQQNTVQPKAPLEAAKSPSEVNFLRQVSPADLAGWEAASLAPAADAFLESCALWERRDPDRLLSSTAPYGGSVADWLPACSALPPALAAGQLHSFFESEFNFYFVDTDEDTNRLTGYFEPELLAFREPQPGYDAPIPGRPSDLVEIRPADFEDNLSSRRLWGQVVDGRLQPYAPRADIEPEADKALGYAHPADVFFLQIQGSGRLRFPDGTTIRAAFDAHNHRRFGSLANYLLKEGEIKRRHANMTGIRAWMDRAGPVASQRAMNSNPRYVFFREEAISDPSKGPKGAMAVPLTAMGSMAVDLQHHPLGVPVFLETTIPREAGDWRGMPWSGLLIAQDTGGAIKGIHRGDVFFGWGEAAGGRAGSMNHPGRYWVLLPKSINPMPIETVQ